MPSRLQCLDEFVSSYLTDGFLRASDYLLVGRTGELLAERSPAFPSPISLLAGRSPGPAQHSSIQFGTHNESCVVLQKVPMS